MILLFDPNPPSLCKILIYFLQFSPKRIWVYAFLISAMAKNLLSLRVFKIGAIFLFPEDPLSKQSFKDGLFWVLKDPLCTILNGVEVEPEFRAMLDVIYEPSPLVSSIIEKIL